MERSALRLRVLAKSVFQNCTWSAVSENKYSITYISHFHVTVLYFSGGIDGGSSIS